MGFWDGIRRKVAPLEAGCGLLPCLRSRSRAVSSRRFLRAAAAVRHRRFWCRSQPTGSSFLQAMRSRFMQFHELRISKASCQSCAPPAAMNQGAGNTTIVLL
jgi:hypothetical protein